MSESITVADGKYTAINDNGKLTALRHGKPWARDLIGDNLVYWMFVRIRELEEAARVAAPAVREGGITQVQQEDNRFIQCEKCTHMSLVAATPTLDIETLRSDAYFIFDAVNADQVVRDVIEWYHASLDTALRKGTAAGALAAPEVQGGGEALCVLKELEWSGESPLPGGNWQQYCCPICEESEHKGHLSGCKLAAAIAQAQQGGGS